MSTTTTVAIAGFTGRPGRLMTAHLLENKSKVTIHGICRKSSEIPSEIPNHPQIKLLRAESTDSTTVSNALRGANVCICCYFGEEKLLISGQRTLIDACVAEGVRRYIAPEYSLDTFGFRLGAFP